MKASLVLIFCVSSSLSKIKDDILANEINEDEDNESDILSYYSKAQKSIVRDRIIAGEKRIDLILKRDSSVIFLPHLNISDEVLNRLNERTKDARFEVEINKPTVE